MLRRWIVAAAVAVGSLGGLALTMPAAHASGPSVCTSLNVSVNGMGTSQNICLPPATPTLP